jgi:hypothetical protein
MGMASGTVVDVLALADIAHNPLSIYVYIYLYFLLASLIGNKLSKTFYLKSFRSTVLSKPKPSKTKNKLQYNNRD